MPRPALEATDGRRGCSGIDAPGRAARQRTSHPVRRVVPAGREPLARPTIGSPAASRVPARTVPCWTEFARRQPGAARASRARADRLWARRPAMRRRRARHVRERPRRMSARSPRIPAPRGTRAVDVLRRGSSSRRTLTVSCDARSTPGANVAAPARGWRSRASSDSPRGAGRRR